MKPRVFLPAILSGLLLWPAFFPLDLGPIGFVALVPWLSLVRAPVTNRRRYLAAYVGGVAFFFVALNWLPVAHPMMYFSWVGLTLVCPLFWVTGLWFIRRLDRLGFPLAVSFPVAWVALEYTRAHFPTGFSFLTHVGLHQKIGFGWYFLGYTQHAFSQLLQVADLGGVYAVSFLVAAVNGLAAEWALRMAVVRRWLRWPVAEVTPTSRWIVPSTVGVAMGVVGAIGYGVVRLDHPAFLPGPRVAAIQGNMPQAEKTKRGENLGELYFRLHVQAIAQSPLPDLIVWPETCMPVEWAEVAPGESLEGAPSDFLKKREVAEHFLGKSDLRKKYLDWRSEKPDWHVTTLFGLGGLEWEGGKVWKYNSALAIDRKGNKLGRYDKMHLIPFGEYVPFRETFPWMNAFTPYDHDYSCRPGEHWTRFPLTTADGRSFLFGCLICYEDSDPYLARQYAGEVDPVDFLVNISNDGWFDGTEEHEQHLAICRFRAVETRRSIVRAVNMGISALIDPDGRVVAIPGESWSASKKIEAVLTVEVPIDHRESSYARLGDWAPAVCWLVIVVGFVAGRFVARAGAS